MPSGLLPALEVDGQLWTESADIMSLLEVRLPRMPLQECANLCHQVRRDPQRLDWSSRDIAVMSEDECRKFEPDHKGPQVVLLLSPARALSQPPLIPCTRQP